MTRSKLDRPTIGVPAVFTTASWGFWRGESAHLVADTYISALWDAGALPLVIPPLGADEPAIVRRVLSRIDGILMVGGADIHPSLYGQAPATGLEETSPVRDGFEAPLIRAALEQDIPLLGICRGVQLMNVVTGGTLHQDLLTAGLSDHRMAPGSLIEGCFHDVNVVDGSLLASITSATSLLVNSHHHQGIANIGSGAVVSAVSTSDGLPEALEWPDRRFALGVQWHPEKPRTDELFAALVSAAASATATDLHRHR